MSKSAKRIITNSKQLSAENKEALEAEAKTIMQAFADNMKNNVSETDESNVKLLQQHFDWAKKSITTSKVEYLNMVKRYSTDQRNLSALNSIEPGLPVYLKAVAMRNIAKIK